MTCEQGHGLRDARMDMEWIYFVRVLERKRDRERGSVVGVSPIGFTPAGLGSRG